jgi:rubrerythrin
MTITRTVAVLAMTAGLTLAVESARAQSLDGRTLPALRMAYASEVTAHTEYEAYADRAEADGLLGVRDLFLALAQCESEHAARHARMLESAGETPVAITFDPVVGTTRDNLERAFANERQERRSRYTRLADAVRPELDYDVLANLQWCAAAEATHAHVLAVALGSLDSLREAHVWYACPECGCLRADRTTDRCACGMSASTMLALGGAKDTPRAMPLLSQRPLIAGIGLGFWLGYAAAEMQR